MTPKKVAFTIIITGLIAAVLVVSALQKRTDESKKRYLAEQTATQQLAWQAALRMHQESMETYFEEHVLSPATLAILRRAQDPKTRDEARKALAKHLEAAYRVMRERGIRQLHFHLPNGDSLFRFHHPSRYGDNLFEARHSVFLANTQKIATSGFEAGKVVSGFRNVFPILAPGGEHLGSVELSLPFGVIRQAIAHLQPDREFELIISANQLQERLFESQKTLYAPWLGSTCFRVEDPQGLVQGSQPDTNQNAKALAVLLGQSPEGAALLNSGQSGSVALRHQGRDYTATLTVARDIQDQVAGFLVGYRPTPALAAINQNFKSSLFSSLLTLAVLAVALWLLVKNRTVLKDEKERLETIYNTIGEGLYVMDRSGAITHANQSATRLLGFEREELIGSIAHSLFHAHSYNDKLPLEACPIFKTIHSRKPFDGNEYFRRKDGSIITVRVFSRPLFEKDEVIGSVTTFEDITEENKTRLMLQTIYDLLPVGITVTDPEGNIIDCNAASETILGITKADHLARNYADKTWKIIRPDGSVMPPSEYASVRALKEQRSVRAVEMGIEREDGIRWISVSALPAKNPDYGVVVAYVDVTERRNAERAFRNLSEQLADQVEHEVAERLKSETKYRHLFNAVPDAILVHGFDENGMPSNFSEVNDAACALTGLDRQGLRQISPLEFSAHRSEQETAKLAATLRQKGRLEIEEETVAKNGAHKTVLTMARLVQLADKPTVITVIRDITELKKLQQDKELQQALLIQQSKQAELGSMIGAIAHQWKQPLNAIAIMTQNLLDSYDYNELDRNELESHIRKVMDQVQFMSHTINDFRDFYKPAKTKAPFSPLAAIESVAGLLKTQLAQHHIALTIQGDGALQTLGYGSEFKQVALNLINNARDVFEEKQIADGRINITVEAAQEQIKIVLEDNGGGIAPELLPDKLFEPFSSTKGEKGTGIGLSLARTIIEEKMNGRLSAENGKEGARFCILLPLNSNPKAGS